MRLLLLAFIFFLALTLGNAFLMRREQTSVSAHDFAPIQITQPHARKYEWDAFVWREIGVLVFTVLVFGTVAAVRPRAARRAARGAKR